jgi:hypothetical protein
VKRAAGVFGLSEPFTLATTGTVPVPGGLKKLHESLPGVLTTAPSWQVVPIGVAGLPKNVTVMLLVKPFPSTNTLVPPAVEPLFG